MRTDRSKLLVMSVLIGLSSRAHAQTYSIDWHSIAGGGSTSTGGAFTVTGTPGQSDASAELLVGGSFSLTGGFWSIFAAQESEPPLLSIELQGANVLVMWPLSSTGFALEHSFQLTGAWSQVSPPYATNATEISISAATSSRSRFFRLRKP